MKRIWIGIGLLLVMLALGIGTAAVMADSHAPGGEALKQAAEYAQDEDWPSALRLKNEAEARWNSRWHLTAAVTAHAELEEIDGLFAQLQVYEDSRDAASFSATAVYLAQALDALAHAQQLTWWNLL